ncbi:hypothetical protein FACS1894187_10570 [Synergistales bacterium]|nr:hypothetical protein FACS1894187_10570 [Synergistales bacterium]
MIPQGFTVRHDSGYLKLRLPNFFEKASLEDIRKVMTLLKKNPSLNETAHETLEKFFPVWEVRIRYRSKAELEDRTKAELEDRTSAKKRRRTMSLDDAVKHAKAALERYGKIIDAYKRTKA